MKKILLICFLAVTTIFSSVDAQWTTNTAVNTQIGYANHSLDPLSATTSDGKTYISFYNNASGNYNMYLQLLDIDGNKRFGPNGLLVTNINSGSATYTYHLAVDHDDNAIIAFQYQGSSGMEAIAFKIDTTGNQQWGIGAGIDLGPGLAPAIGVLASNDVVFAWISSGIQYMKYSSTGVAQWAMPLTVVSPTAHSVSLPQIVPMSNDDFMMLFTAQPGASFQVVNHYAQRYNGNGTPLWANATELSPATAGFFNPLSWVPDGNDGCYVSFAGGLTPTSNDVFAQHLLSNGSVDWGTNGVDVSDISSNEIENYIAHDPETKMTWVIERETDASQGQSGLFIQKFDSSGNKLLGANARMLFPVSSLLYYPIGLQLMNGEPVFVYTNSFNTYNAMRLDTSANPVWTPDTTVICSLGDVKSRSHLTSFMNSQAVCVWSDGRGGNSGVYAQNILPNGSLGPLGIAVHTSPESTVSLFPNPASDWFTVSGLQFAADDILFDVFNALGEKVCSTKISKNQKETSVDVSDFPHGIYFVKIYSGDFQHVSKLVVN